MATNAGIFSPERRPLGLHVEDGQQLWPRSVDDGEGNFYLRPNGIFWIDEQGAHVAATEECAPRGSVHLATQSGPLLLSGGRMHPAFEANSQNLRLRSAVGVDGDGHVVVALSRSPVTFYETATLFREALGCGDALYLDGEISGIAAPGLGAPPTFDYGSLLVATWRKSGP